MCTSKDETGGRKEKLCRAKYCRRIPAKRSKTPYCARCKTRQARERNPYAYFLRKLRGNAKRRGKECSLTLEEFKYFCDETGYLELRGRCSGCMTIDREDNEEGYHFWNIKIMEHDDNIRKGHVAYFQNRKE